MEKVALRMRVRGQQQHAGKRREQCEQSLAVGTAPGTAEGGDKVVENIASTVTDEKQLAAIDTVFGAMKDAKALPFQWTSDMATYMTQQIALAVNGEADPKTQLDRIVEYANANRVDQ